MIGMYKSVGFSQCIMPISPCPSSTCEMKESKTLTAFLSPANLSYFECIFPLCQYLLSIYWVLNNKEFVPGSWYGASNSWNFPSEGNILIIHELPDHTWVYANELTLGGPLDNPGPSIIWPSETSTMELEGWDFEPAWSPGSRGWRLGSIGWSVF